MQDRRTLFILFLLCRVHARRGWHLHFIVASCSLCSHLDVAVEQTDLSQCSMVRELKERCSATQEVPETAVERGEFFSEAFQIPNVALQRVSIVVVSLLVCVCEEDDYTLAVDQSAGTA